MHESLPSPWREWVADQAARMGLPSPDDYLILLVRLEKQRQELEPITWSSPALKDRQPA